MIEWVYSASQINKVNYYLLFCSISLLSSGWILSLSTWSRRTLAHFCSDSIMVHGRDISATNTAKQSGSDLAETANLSKPLWYTSPSRIHTLQRVRSAKEKQNNTGKNVILNYMNFVKASAEKQTTKIQWMNSPSLSSSWTLKYRYSSPLPFLLWSAPWSLAISVVFPDPSSPGKCFYSLFTSSSMSNKHHF